MKNVLLITSEYGERGGGLSFACKRFHSLLCELHYNVQLVSSTANSNLTVAGGYKETLAQAISNEYRLKSDCLKYNNKIDLVIAFGGDYNGYYAATLAKLLSAEFILMFRGSDINLCKWNAEEITYFTYASQVASKIICLSEEMKTNIVLLSNDNSDKTLVVPNIIIPSVKRICFRNLEKQVIIGTAAAHINEKKGIANLLAMVAEFKKISHVSIRFDVVGKIDNDVQKQYLDLARKLNVYNEIRWIDYISREDYHKLIDEWDFYVQGSICEGFGNSVTEAIREGKAILLSPTGYIAEKLRMHFPMLVFNSWNPNEMAKHLIHLCETEQKESYYEEAYKSLLKFASKEVVTDLWDKILHNNKSAEGTLPSIRVKNGILAVTLHDVNGESHDNITTPISVFEKFVEDLHSNGYGLCSMKDWVHKKNPEQWIVCTFDDGYSSLVDSALSIMDRYHYTATVFVCTSLIGRNNDWNPKDTKVRNHLTWNQLDMLSSHGWEIASHGVTHRCLLKLSDNDLINEFTSSQKTLSTRYGNVLSYAYPYGMSNEFIQKCAGRYYENAFSLSQGGTHLECDRLQIKRYFISEIYKILHI